MCCRFTQNIGFCLHLICRREKEEKRLELELLSSTDNLPLGSWYCHPPPFLHGLKQCCSPSLSFWPLLQETGIFSTTTTSIQSEIQPQPESRRPTFHNIQLRPSFVDRRLYQTGYGSYLNTIAIPSLLERLEVPDWDPP